MEILHFAHISDTHLTCGGSSPFMQRVAREVRDLWDNLKDCLCQLQGKALDFVLLTGDLVHEGEEEDYKALKRLLEEKNCREFLCAAPWGTMTIAGPSAGGFWERIQRTPVPIWPTPR